MSNLTLPKSITEFIATSSYLTIGSAAICLTAATEMAIKTIFDKNKENISADLGEALFYGLCATNIIPGSAIAGGIIFSLYSLVYAPTFLKEKNTYKSSLLLKNIIKEPATLLYNVISKIGEITFKILSKISLPKHPVWILTGTLVVAIAIKVILVSAPITITF